MNPSVNEIVGYCAPVVKGEQIVVPLRMPAGLVTLSARRELFVALARTILASAGEYFPNANDLTAPQVKRRKAIHAPEREALYLKVEELHDKHLIPFVHGCRRVGVPSGAFSQWRFRRRLEASSRPGP